MHLKVEEDGEKEDYGVESQSSTVNTDHLQWTGEKLTDKVMSIWHRRKEHVCHHYLFVRFLMSPNPTIMEEAEKHIDEHKQVAALINKLFLDPVMIGQPQFEKRASLIHTFW